jgi:hypothetical protein
MSATDRPSRFEPVADPANRADRPGFPGSRPERAPQPLHGRPQPRALVPERRAEGAGQQLGVGHGKAIDLEQPGQHRPIAPRKWSRHPAEPNLAPVQIHERISNPSLACGQGGPMAAYESPHAGSELHRVERRGHEVVRPVVVEGLHGVHRTRPTPQPQDRDRLGLRMGPKLATQASLGEPRLEHDRIGMPLRERIRRLAESAALIREESFGSEGARDQPADGDVTGGDENDGSFTLGHGDPRSGAGDLRARVA